MARLPLSHQVDPAKSTDVHQVLRDPSPANRDKWLLVLICAALFGVVQSFDGYDVRMPPNIQPTSTPAHILYRNEMEIVLPCQASGVPKPKYEWYFNGDQLDLNQRNLRFSSDPANGALTITSMSPLDEGYYQCRAINFHGTSLSKVFFLQRASLGRFPPAIIKSYTAKEGMSLRLQCHQVRSTPRPSYSWALVKTTTDGNPKSLRTTPRIINDEYGHLYFSYVKKEDARIIVGEPYPSLLYQCRVFNPYLDVVTSSSYSRIIVEPGDNSDEPPTILNKTPSPYYAVRGEQMRMQCIFAGKPEVRVTWDLMPDGRTTTEEHGTVLLITEVKFEDAGRYTCTGRNSAGQASESILVVVQSKPEFLQKPISLNITEGQNVSFECRTTHDTHPKADISWYINGEPVNTEDLGSNTEISDSGHKLTMRTVCKHCLSGWTDLQVIQCNASNVHGYAFADAYLNVLLSTWILIAPKDQTLEPDETQAVFSCGALSDPSTPVFYSWTRDDRKLDFYNDPHMKLGESKGKILLFDLRGLKLSDKKKFEGVYACHATNGYSAAVKTAKLRIIGAVHSSVCMPPNIQPTSTPAHILYRDEMEIVLPCQASGVPRPKYEWYFNGDVLDLNQRSLRFSSDPANGALTITSMSPLEEGYYQCRAINIYGSSLSKVFFLQRASFGHFPAANIKSYTVKEGMSLRLECNHISSSPRLSYSWALAKTTSDWEPKGLATTPRIVKNEYGHLYFSFVMKEDAQMIVGESHPSLLYKCRVFNPYLDVVTSGSYSRIIVEPGDNSDKPPTILYKTTSPYIAVKGEQMRMQCIFAGKPEVRVTWDPTPDGHSMTEEHGTVVLIREVKFEDAGRYTCTGRNSAGHASESILVVVQSKPEFLRKPISVNVTEGQNISLECRTTHDTQPNAYMSWYINGEAVNTEDPGPRTEVSDSGHKLTIRTVCKDCLSGSSDLKVVQCNASNVHGYAFADAYLNILSSTRILIAPKDQTLESEDTYALFSCEAISDPSTPVLYSWTRDNQQLGFYNDPNIKLGGSKGKILLVDLRGLELADKKKYEGVYACHATNGYSAAVKMANLRIVGIDHGSESQKETW